MPPSLRSAVLAVASLATVLAAARPAHALPCFLGPLGCACAATISKEYGKYVKMKAKVLLKCNDTAVKNGTSDSAPGGGAGACSANLALCDPAGKVAIAAQKFHAKVIAKCAGVAIPSIINWPSTCPNFEHASCTNPIGTSDDVATCLQCIGDAAVCQAMDLYYEDLVNPAADTSLINCQRTVGKESTKFLLAKDKILRRCRASIDRGTIPGPCPDALAQSAISAAESRKVGKICRACDTGSVDGVNCSGTDKFTPAEIGITTCEDVQVPAGGGAGDCGSYSPIDSVTELAKCVDCATEFKADCIDRATAPHQTSYPTECNVHTCGGNRPAGLYTNLEIVVDSVTRVYDLYIPPACHMAGCPLVLDFHGFTSNKTDQRTISGFRSLADSAPFLVAFPQGRFGLPLGNPDGESANPLDGPSWNAGVCCGRAVTEGVDDVAFARAVVADVACQTPVDAQRVYATGISNGGGMAQRLACEASDVFAGAAPIASPLMLDPLTQCAPGRPVPMIQFAGSTDPIVPYAGGSLMFPTGGPSCTPPDVSLATLVSATASFQRWRDVNSCGSGAPDETVPVNGGTCERYTNCAGGVEVEFCSITGDDGGSIGGQSFCPFLPSCFDGHILYCNQDLASLAVTAWGFLWPFSLP